MSDKNDIDPSIEAQRRLDQMRHEAGGALTGEEVRQRHGLNPKDAQEDPPLDFRLTPRNVILQLIAIAAFFAAIWFIVQTLFLGGISLFGQD